MKKFLRKNALWLAGTGLTAVNEFIVGMSFNDHAIAVESRRFIWWWYLTLFPWLFIVLYRHIDMKYELRHLSRFGSSLKFALEWFWNEPLKWFAINGALSFLIGYCFIAGQLDPLKVFTSGRKILGDCFDPPCPTYSMTVFDEFAQTFLCHVLFNFTLTVLAVTAASRFWTSEKLFVLHLSFATFTVWATLSSSVSAPNVMSTWFNSIWLYPDLGLGLTGVHYFTFICLMVFAAFCIIVLALESYPEWQRRLVGAGGLFFSTLVCQYISGDRILANSLSFLFSPATTFWDPALRIIFWSSTIAFAAAIVRGTWKWATISSLGVILILYAAFSLAGGKVEGNFGVTSLLGVLVVVACVVAVALIHRKYTILLPTLGGLSAFATYPVLPYSMFIGFTFWTVVLFWKNTKEFSIAKQT